MSQELLYTSAPRGLRPGSRGFCTVLSTHGMAAPLATALEGLSGYRPIYPPGHANAGRNPIVYSHLKLQATGRTLSVLSRIADYGLDYSQRANKLAHHVVVEKSELLRGGPANLLLTGGILRTEWDGEPMVVASKLVSREADPPTGVCRAWEQLTGDAGWAGVLAESFLKDPDRLVILLFSPGQDILPLFVESISLLPPSRRWDVTFSTYFTTLATGTTCLWRAMVHDSKEAHESLRFVNALRVDLTSKSLGNATGGSLVEAARRGGRPSDTAARQPSRGPLDEVFQPVTEEEFVELKESQLRFATAENEDGEIRIAGVPPRPPKLSPRSPSSLSSSSPATSGRRARQEIEETPDGRFTTRWAWLTIAVVGLLLTATTFGIATGRIQITKSTSLDPSDEKSLAKKALVEQSPSNGTSTGPKDQPRLADSSATTGTPTLTDTIQGQTSASTISAENHSLADKGAVDSTVSITEPKDAPVNTAGEVDAATAVKLDKPTAVPLPSAVPPLKSAPEVSFIGIPDKDSQERSVTILKFNWIGKKPVPTYDDLFTLMKQGPVAEPNFRMAFEVLPPKMQLLLPLWVKWKEQRPKGTSPEKVLHEISVENVPGSKPHATFNLIANPLEEDGRKFKYVLKRTNSNEASFLSWCAIQVYEGDTAGGPTKRIFLHPPLEVSADHRKLLKKQHVDWKTSWPVDETHSPMLSVRDLTLLIGSERYSAEGATWETSKPVQLPLKSLSEFVSREIGVTIDKGAGAFITIPSLNESRTLTITVSLDNIFGVNGMLQRVHDSLKSERESLATALRATEGIDPLRAHVNRLFEDKSDDSVNGAKSLVQDFIKNTLQELKDKHKGNEAELGRLWKLEEELTALPEKMSVLRQRYQRFLGFKHDLDKVDIVSTKITFDLFELADVKHERPVTASIVDFDDNMTSDPDLKGAQK